MKLIQLKSVYFFTGAGITLTEEKPFVEATEENLSKLSDYINKGFLEVVEIKPKENKKTETKVEKNTQSNEEQEIIVETKRYLTYSKEELKAMNKKELIKICQDNQISYKPNMKVSELEKLILKNL